MRLRAARVGAEATRPRPSSRPRLRLGPSRGYQPVAALHVIPCKWHIFTTLCRICMLRQSQLLPSGPPHLSDRGRPLAMRAPRAPLAGRAHTQMQRTLHGGGLPQRPLPLKQPRLPGWGAPAPAGDPRHVLCFRPQAPAACLHHPRTDPEQPSMPRCRLALAPQLLSHTSLPLHHAHPSAAPTSHATPCPPPPRAAPRLTPRHHTIPCAARHRIAPHHVEFSTLAELLTKWVSVSFSSMTE